MIKRFATAAVLTEQLEAQLTRGQRIDMAAYSLLCNTLVRIAQAMGVDHTDPQFYATACGFSAITRRGVTRNDFPHEKLARWRADPIKFIQEVLIDPETGRPFVLLDAERTFLKHAFATGPDGRLLYPEQIYSCPKKSGKTTFAAIFVITIVLLFGGKYAEAICAANDREQSVGRVFATIKRIIECSPLLRNEAKIIADKITIAGAVISAIPSNYASAAGANPVVTVFDELWAYSLERLRRLFDELVPPPTRLIACRLTVTYAGFEGEGTLLEELYRRGLKQPQIGPNLYAGNGILMFWSHEPVAPWQTEAWLAEMRRSLRLNQFLSMVENRFVTTENAFVELPLGIHASMPSSVICPEIPACRYGSGSIDESSINRSHHQRWDIGKKRVGKCARQPPGI